MFQSARAKSADRPFSAISACGAISIRSVQRIRTDLARAGDAGRGSGRSDGARPARVGARAAEGARIERESTFACDPGARRSFSIAALAALVVLLAKQRTCEDEGTDGGKSPARQRVAGERAVLLSPWILGALRFRSLSHRVFDRLKLLRLLRPLRAAIRWSLELTAISTRRSVLVGSEERPRTTLRSRFRSGFSPRFSGRFLLAATCAESDSIEPSSSYRRSLRSWRARWYGYGSSTGSSAC